MEKPFGFVVIDKPAGLTSHDCVNRLRKVFGIKKVGHSGTLDPSVTGVLPIAIGNATRLISYLKGSKVTYQDLESSGIERGFSTNLDDPKRTYGTFRANLRHPLGYTALPQVTPTNLGFQIWSESALRLRKTITSPRATGCLTSLLPDSGPGAIVEDHIAGSTASGAKIFKTYRDCGWDLDYILQEWLPNEIINYLIVLVRHEEHQFDEAIGKKGIPRGDVFSLDDGDKSITLRYDLSSPLARFYAQNNQELPSIFKRYQIQNVFRNEKAGNGRYREFLQADFDIVGNVNPAQANAELCNLIFSILSDCGLKNNQFTINVSNRKIVQGLINDLKISEEKQIKVIRAIDKLDKPGFGLKGVEDLLKKERKDQSGAVTKGADLSNEQAALILNFLKIKDLKELKQNLKNPLSQEGIKELENIFEVLGYGSNLNQVKTNFTIVRGLSYYSDFIVETNLNFKVTNNKGKEVDIGSICSGGAYAKLISRFRGVDVPGTGISFGVDRLLFALMQLDQIKVEDQKPILVCVMDQKYLKNYYEIVDLLRENNINAEVFLSTKKNLGKQLELANKRELSVAVICGENEFKDNTVTIKNLKGVKGENSQTIPKSNLINEIKKLI